MAERDHSKNKNPVLGPDEREKKRGRPLRGRGRGRPPHDIVPTIGNILPHEFFFYMLLIYMRVLFVEDLSYHLVKLF